MAETKLSLKQLKDGGAVEGQVLWFIGNDWIPGSAIYLLDLSAEVAPSVEYEPINYLEIS